MLQSLMVFPNNNDFFHMGAAMIDDANNVAKLMNTEEIEHYLTSASTSPIQDYLMAPSSNTCHPQQQNQNQRQHQLQFSSVVSSTPMPSMVPHSAPSSPSFPVIKSEDVQQQQQNMEYMMFQPTFDTTTSSSTSVSSQSHHILPSQHSPQQRMMPYADVSLIQQRQHHQQQQQQHAQQLRLQHQQQQRALHEQQQYQQQQMMYEATPNHPTATSMSMTIPVTSAVMSSIAGSTTTVTTTSAPFDLSFQRQPQSSYTPAAHPAAPKRKREESGQMLLLPRQSSPQLTVESSPAISVATAVTANHLPEESSAVTPSRRGSAATTTVVATSSSRLSTSSRLDKVKTTRSTIVTKSSFSSTSSSSSSTEMITATPATESKPATTTARGTTKKASTRKTTIPTPESRESSQQPENTVATETSNGTAIAHLSTSTGNITHPRRAAQNRAAQRTFRNRRKAYIKELEHKVQDMDRTRELMESIHLENQEVWRRLQILEALASQSGLQVPVFPTLTPSFLGNATQSTNGMILMGSSNDEEEDDDEDMSDSYLRQQF
ncbi:hypothetical protein BGX28_005881 [Mortierella sp. GBA30]|nr:hypothetical protein BGX28_005881 [Mortierella sp. GBA30]